ncbi:hydrolase 1, exosortase A system-associated [Aurantiacibacter gangjinensis]|uniref:Uncharacterized protein n=1 Tax=Aurantiacibacter gangjinensis TaxID=502682 RepID=A0A0G9MQX3_9SPHN|nr:hydrolase 1, exosortase A system-associated [Aurantiacibacter gangjinensis]APE28880.1 Esterase/lipase/thioesterase family active site [Aurantiacibacter gangjinensis]KLE33014.1 hypothetical protein AAW01_03145 [Aurantiacibacter gangjinensis]
MTRRFLSFTCEGAILQATLDEAPGPVGLLIVSGGNEIRSGAFGGQADLAKAMQACGYSVMRFDRRGIGDSGGENGGFQGSAPDIRAAIAAFRDECPALSRVVAYGNCDAASALMLSGGAGCDGVVLSNPWPFEADGETGTPPAVARARYAERFRQPRALGRFASGGKILARLFKALRASVGSAPAPSRLMRDMESALDDFGGETTILISSLDRTGQAFNADWRGDGHIVTVDGADHAFSGREARAQLYDAIGSALHEQARQLDMG